MSAIPRVKDPAASSTSSVLPERKSNAKRLLRSYYGINSEAKKTDPNDIDNASFDPDRYLQRILREKSLNTLMQRDNDLVTEIRQLDSDMKTLVYENYNKFISATDTIRKMKSNVEDMDSEMKRLSENMSKITTACSSINSVLAPRRDRIDQLSSIHSLLRKLQFIFELPTYLDHCLQSQSYRQAVLHFARTSQLLERYRHLSVFNKIEAESNEIMLKISETIRQKLRSPDASCEAITENVGLLIVLKDMPMRELWTIYIRTSMQQLQLQKAAVLEKLPTLPIEPSRLAEESSTDAELLDRTSYLNSTLLHQLNEFVKSFSQFFLETHEGFLDAIEDERGQSFVSQMGSSRARSASSLSARSRNSSTAIKGVESFPKNKMLLISANLPEEEREKARADLLEALSPLLEEYFSIVKGILSIADHLSSSQNPIIYAINRLHSDIYSCDALNSIADFESRVMTEIAECESEIVRQTLGVAANGLQKRLASYSIDADTNIGRQSIKTTETSEQEPFRSPPVPASSVFLTTVIDWFTSTLTEECLPFLEKCINADFPYLKRNNGKENFLLCFQENFKEFWETCLNLLMQSTLSATQTPQATHTLPSEAYLALFATRVSMCFSEKVVMNMYDAFSRRLYSSDDSRMFQDERALSNGSVIIGNLLPDAKDAVGMCKEYTQRFINRYVELVGNSLSYHVRSHRFSQNRPSLATVKPERPSSVWNHIIQQIAVVERELEPLFGVNIEEDDSVKDLSSESSRRYSTREQGSNLFHGSGANTGGGGFLYGTGSNASMSSFHSTQTSNAGGMGGGGGSRGHVYEPAAGHQHHLLLNHIDRLFSERVEIFGRVEISRTGVMLGLIKILIKALIETLRMQTLTQYDFQQVQLDVEYLRVHLWRFTPDEKLMNSMLEEAVSCAYRRCIDPLPLEAAYIENIVNR
ncbi:uncharacterized protein VTP21DRAFT_4941 [Calcarisporiella thermophila]|uniref:uncharacterized protein n=1 Tax=Calcarisporiella thermophila TaxID=911321 RepID=UPI003744457C